MRRAILATAVASLSFAVAHCAWADEQMVPLAVSGDWIALAHRESMIARPDVCAVINGQSGLAFRSDADGTQIRITDEHWTLPVNVEGSIAVSVGDWKTSFDIDDNTDTMVNAEVPADVVLPMFAAMDKAASMSITVGKAKPFPVSLAGSTRATNAFRTCAGIEGSPTTPGSNPFK